MKNSVELLGHYGSDEVIALSAWTSYLKNLKTESVTGVYCIYCCINHKYYVGSSNNIYKRLTHHANSLEKNKHRNLHLQSAYNLYGASNFSTKILETCNIDVKLTREEHWIDYYKSFEDGFNQSKKANSPFGYKHSEETRKRLSDMKIALHKIGMLPKNLKTNPVGYKHKEETKLKISLKNSGEGNGMYGKKEDTDKKKKRMEHMLSTPKWNKGKTKYDDPRLLKLGAAHIGKLPHNAIKVKLLNTETMEFWEASSLKALSKICPLSLPTISRLASKTTGKRISNLYTLIKYE